MGANDFADGSEGSAETGGRPVERLRNLMTAWQRDFARGFPAATGESAAEKTTRKKEFIVKKPQNADAYIKEMKTKCTNSAERFCAKFLRVTFYETIDSLVRGDFFEMIDKKKCI